MIFLLSAIRTNSLKSGFKDGIPRLFGEKQFGAPNPDVTQGSPPPMRGKALRTRAGHVYTRITPAYAGKSRLFRHRLPAGSPPPMRGKAAHYTGGSIECRITPAYAGKRQPSPVCCMQCEDHPRLCGEKKGEDRLYNAEHGSPPPMRGKVSKENVPVLINGITPAYAGKRFQIYCRLILL